LFEGLVIIGCLEFAELKLFNLQLAIQCCVDIASHLIADNDWGVPSNMGDAFQILFDRKVINDSTRDIMQAMTRFRNLIIHVYARLDLEKVYDLIKNHLDDFAVYLNEIVVFAKL
jgi:uncharacterized protein YutE (UPF0331/DUF86 family)